MSNALYTKAAQKLLEGAINWLTDDIKVVLVDLGAYTPNLATDEFLSDIPAGARVATSTSLTGKTTTDGAADAADVVFATVSGPTVEVIAIYKDTGNAATSPLIAYIDTMTGLPLTPTGGNVTVSWDNGPERIFKLS